jgi:hypothetical protein
LDLTGLTGEYFQELILFVFLIASATIIFLTIRLLTRREKPVEEVLPIPKIDDLEKEILPLADRGEIREEIRPIMGEKTLRSCEYCSIFKDLGTMVCPNCGRPLNLKIPRERR